MWVPPEIKDPILQHAPTRKSVACFGAVSLRTGQFVRMMCAVFNAETFQDFLKRLLRHHTRGSRLRKSWTTPAIITPYSCPRFYVGKLDA